MFGFKRNRFIAIIFLKTCKTNTNTNLLFKIENIHSFDGQGVGALYIVMDALKRRRAEEKEKEEK